jgi:Transposase DDE domain
MPGWTAAALGRGRSRWPLGWCGRPGRGCWCSPDREFPGAPLWRAFAATGADLLWRVPANRVLEVDRALPDGSWLSRVDAAGDRPARPRRNPVRVRVVAHALDVDGPGRPDAGPYRLLTTLLDWDWERYPARELAALSAQRWEEEERFQTAKGLVGLDQHQVRHWRSWYRWVTLAMLAHAFLVVAALAERTRQPPRSGLIPMTCNELQHLSRHCSPSPPVISATGCAGRCGDAGIRHAPAPATTADRRPCNHDLRLECSVSGLVSASGRQRCR